MPIRLVVFFAAVLALGALAAEPVKPNTLTAQEIVDGWLLLFDGETGFGWKTDSTIKTADGALVFLKAGTIRAPLVLRHSMIAYDISFEGTGEFSGRVEEPTLSADLNEKCEEAFLGTRWRRLQWTMHREVSPLQFFQSKFDRILIRNVKIRPLQLKSLFNSKDLAGWKIHPGKKSKFTVSPDGWLNVKDGPGDLQTEQQWSDFVLQLECKSWGSHLNSGIFFRAKPGEYQQGYEAQIRNEFTKELRDYTVEDYDPKTHELKGKHVVKSPAVDYGTGAIYRRVPARKQMAKDMEWFTMTVIARGRHISTWVNGVQQVDWTDNRPLSDNARKGCCLNKGVISIQGHDPTTNLSFRNIRIAALPPEK